MWIHIGDRDWYEVKGRENETCEDDKELNECDCKGNDDSSCCDCTTIKRSDATASWPPGAISTRVWRLFKHEEKKKNERKVAGAKCAYPMLIIYSS